MKVLFAGGGTGGRRIFVCRNAEWDGGKVSTTVWVSARNH